MTMRRSSAVIGAVMALALASIVDSPTSFSTEAGFYDQHSGYYAPGDLLSDQGYVVYRNPEFLSAFVPLEVLADFGLDALFLVTDATPPASPPRFGRCSADRETGTLSLQWDGKGRVYQVERAAAVAGPYLPLSPIMPESAFDDVGASLLSSQGFYRLRLW